MPQPRRQPRGSSALPRGTSGQPPVRWGVVLRTVGIVTLVALVGAGALHQLFGNRETGPAIAGRTVLVGPRSVSWPPSYAAVPQYPTAQPSLSLTTVIRLWTDPGIGNTGQTIGDLPLWRTPSSIPLDRAGWAVMRCSGAGPTVPGPWSRIDPRVTFSCPPGTGPEYLANP